MSSDAKDIAPTTPKFGPAKERGKSEGYLRIQPIETMRTSCEALDRWEENNGAARSHF